VKDELLHITTADQIEAKKFLAGRINDPVGAHPEVLVGGELLLEIALDGCGGQDFNDEIGGAKATSIGDDMGMIRADEEQIGERRVIFVEDHIERPQDEFADTGILRSAQLGVERADDLLMATGGRGAGHKHPVQDLVEDAIIR